MSWRRPTIYDVPVSLRYGSERFEGDRTPATLRLPRRDIGTVPADERICYEYSVALNNRAPGFEIAFFDLAAIPLFRKRLHRSAKYHLRLQHQC